MINKRAAVITAKGIGDGLMMMVASERLRKEGYAVTTFNPHLHELSTWFPSHHFATYSDSLEGYDLIIAQNDNSERIKNLIGRDNLSIFYASYEKNKHPVMTSRDRLFDSNLTIVDNIANAIASLLKSEEVSKNNGITPPPHLVFQKYPMRIVIHPTSSIPSRTYCRSKFIAVAKILKKRGFDPLFAVSPREYPEWATLIQEGFSVPKLANLSELANTVYESGYLIGNESGTGHLASNLRLPTLIIGGNKKRLKMWRPGWHPTQVITPPSWVPNWKGSRLRENKWQYFISARHVLSLFSRLQ